MNKKITIISLIVFFALNTFASENSKYWTSTSKKNLAHLKKVNRSSHPTNELYYKLNLNQLKNDLIGAPIRGIDKNSNLIIPFPTTDGNFENFNVMEASIMHPDLQEKYSMIRTYVAQGIDDPTAMMRFSVTQFGLHTMTLSGKRSTSYIEPFTEDREYYILYDRNGLGKDSQGFECLTEDDVHLQSLQENIAGDPAFRPADDKNLRTFRLAQSCNAEYGNLFAGSSNQKANIQAQMAITMNRVNGVFERDLAITMEFVANNDLLIYFGNTGSDPWNGEFNTTTAQTIDAVIGVDNYDIGHNFNTTGGGNAGCLFCVCLSNNQSSTHKGRGYTGRSNPTGDAFDIDYVAHEMGHQFGGYHIMNTCSRSGGGNAEVEPASGSSIMGYAGICTSNVQMQSDDYFNYVNIRDISEGVQTGNSTCAALTPLGNNPPTAEAGDNQTIPANTPFVLEGIASDLDGISSLTYAWDQNDPEQAPSNGSPQSNWTQGPMYRSLNPKTEPRRYFPDIATVIAGNLSSTWEVTPSVSRNMEFSFLVRDNDILGAQTADDIMTVTVDANAGPFQVTSQNSSITYNAFDNATITWNVANTDGGSVNTQNVDIYLSTDGGYTYPTVLISSTPNDGSQSITIPNVATNNARIMVKGSGNVFYSINSSNFTIIESAVPDFTLSASGSQTVCSPNNGSYSVTIGSLLGYTDPVTLSASGNQIGTNVTFSPNPITPGNTSTMTISNTGSATNGTSTITVSGISTSGTKTDDTQLTISGIPTQVSLSSPTNGANNESTSPNLSWGNITDAINYYIQISTDTGFTTIIDNATIATNSYSVSALNISTQYFWRVRAINSCGNGEYSNVFNFTTSNEICNDYNSSNIPVAISSMGTGTYTSTINVNDDINITDLNIIDLVGTHGRLSDLTITLRSPQGTTVELFSGVCGNDDDFDLVFDDASVSSTIACPATSGSSYQPSGSLSNFNGQSSLGVWTLTIVDNRTGFGGNLDSWSMGICGNPPCFAPSINSSPSNSTISANTSTSFSTTATGDGLTYQWQVDVDGVGSGTPFVDISDNTFYGGTNASTLTLTNTPISYNDYTYQCVVTGTCANVTSNSALLTVTGGTPGPGFFHWSYDGIYGKQWGALSPITNTTVFIVPKKFSGASSYTLEINDAFDFTGTSFVKSGNGPNPKQSDYYFTGLTPNTTYFVRVRMDGGDWGDKVHQFTTHDVVQESYVAKTIDGTYGENAPLHMTSLFVVPKEISSVSSYLVEVNTAANFSGTSITKSGSGPNVIQSEYYFQGLEYNTTYYNRVSTDGGTTWGAIKSFTTNIIGASNLHYVVDGKYGKQYAGSYPNPVKVSLFAVPKKVNSATSYTLEICTDSAFTDLATFASKTGTGPSVVKNQYWFGGLLNSTTYYVRVKTDSDPYGRIFWFTTEGLAKPAAARTNSTNNDGLSKASTYEVYPNPFTNEINLRLDSEKEENLMVRISDLTGKVVYQSTRYQTNQTIQLGEGLEDGMYLIQLVHGDQSQLLKVVKK